MCIKFNYIYKCNCRSKGYICYIDKCKNNKYMKQFINKYCYNCILKSINIKDIKIKIRNIKTIKNYK